MQLEDEEYYFKISPASDMADGSPNTACGKTAKSTSGEAAGATVTDSAENRASGDEARAERSPDAAHDMNVEAADETTCKAAGATTNEMADDAPYEYKVYVRDYAQSEDRLFADDFYGFLEKF